MKLFSKNVISGILATATLTAASLTLNPSSAKAWFVFPSGIWANVQGKQFYLGDFVQRPDPQCPVACGWAVRYGGELKAHGNGRTPPWVVELIRNFGKK